MKYDERGHEIHDQPPLQAPIHFRRPPTIQEQIRSMIRTEASRMAAAAGQESWEESDDFDVDDDIELKSPYELDDEQRTIREFVEEVPTKPEASKEPSQSVEASSGPAKAPEQPEKP